MYQGHTAYIKLSILFYFRFAVLGLHCFSRLFWQTFRPDFFLLVDLHEFVSELGQRGGGGGGKKKPIKKL